MQVLPMLLESGFSEAECSEIMQEVLQRSPTTSKHTPTLNHAPIPPHIPPFASMAAVEPDGGRDGGRGWEEGGGEGPGSHDADGDWAGLSLSMAGR